MLKHSQAYRWIPWSWSLAWLLAGMGIWLSDLYSSPSRSLGPYFVLSALGWVIAGLVTARAVGSKSGTVVRLAAWCLAALVAILLGFTWLHGWNMAFFGPIVATGVAGVVGGLAGSMRPGAWRLVSAILLGAAFLVFAFVSFVLTYFLMLVATSIAQEGGDITVLNALLWLLPGAVCGLGAGFALRWILGLKKPGSKQFRSPKSPTSGVGWVAPTIEKGYLDDCPDRVHQPQPHQGGPPRRVQKALPGQYPADPGWQARYPGPAGV